MNSKIEVARIHFWCRFIPCLFSLILLFIAAVNFSIVPLVIGVFLGCFGLVFTLSPCRIVWLEEDVLVIKDRVFSSVKIPVKFISSVRFFRELKCDNGIYYATLMKVSLGGEAACFFEENRSKSTLFKYENGFLISYEMCFAQLNNLGVDTLNSRL